MTHRHLGKSDPMAHSVSEHLHDSHCGLRSVIRTFIPHSESCAPCNSICGQAPFHPTDAYWI